MSKTIKKIGLDALRVVFKSKVDKHVHTPGGIFDIHHKVIISKHDPDLTTPVKTHKDFKECHTWGITTSLEKLEIIPDGSIADSIYTNRYVVIPPTTFRTDRILLELSHLVIVNQIVDVVDKIITREYTIYALTEAAMFSIRDGSITQNIFHKTGTVVTIA